MGKSSKPLSEYEKARDKYGRLTKDEKSRVLDLVSAKTNAQSGAEAEQAFVDAIAEVTERTNHFMYGGGVFLKAEVATANTIIQTRCEHGHILIVQLAGLRAQDITDRGLMKKHACFQCHTLDRLRKAGNI